MKPKALSQRARHLALISLGFGLFGAVCLMSFALLPPASVLILVGRKDLFGFATRWSIRQTFRWVLWYLRLFGFLDAQVIEHAPDARAGKLIVGNHTSMFDVICLLAYFPDASTFIKSNFLRIPFILPAVKAAGYIPIDVTDAGQRTNAFMKGLAVLRSGRPLIVFPEGTRSRDGKIGRFQAGVFKLALEAGQDITPVLFTSDQPIFNKVGLFQPSTRTVRFRAHILPRIPTPRDDGTMNVAAKRFRDRVEGEFAHWLSTDLAGAWNKIDAAATACTPPLTTTP